MSNFLKNCTKIFLSFGTAVELLIVSSSLFNIFFCEIFLFHKTQSLGHRRKFLSLILASPFIEVRKEALH